MNPGDPQERLLNPNYIPQNDWNFNAAFDPIPPPTHEPTGLIVRLPPLMPTTRRSTRQRASSNASGSEYHASNTSMDVDDQGELPEPEDDEEEQTKVLTTSTSRGRTIKRPVTYEESEEDSNPDHDDAPDPLNIIDQPEDAPGDDDGEGSQPYRLRKRVTKSASQMNGIILSDDEGGATVGRFKYNTRNRSKMPQQPMHGTSGGRITRRSNGGSKQNAKRPPQRQSTRRTRSSARLDEQDGNYEDEGEPTSSAGSQSGGSAIDEELEEDANDLEMGGADADAEGEPEEQESDGKPYALRQRTKINYAIPPPLEEMKAPPPKPRNAGRANGRSFGRSKAPGWSATGAELSRWMGGGDDSVCFLQHLAGPGCQHVDRTPTSPAAHLERISVASPVPVAECSPGAQGLVHCCREILPQLVEHHPTLARSGMRVRVTLLVMQ